MRNQCQHLKETQRNELPKILQKIKELLYGTLGTWKIDPVDIKSKEGVKPIWSIPYPVPKIHREIFKKEVEHLVLLVAIERSNNSEWVSPSFVKHKPKKI